MQKPTKESFAKPGSRKHLQAVATITDKALDQVVSRGRDVGGKPDATNTNSSLRRATRGERMAIYVPAKLKKKIRIFAATKGRSVSDVATKALEQYLDEE